MAYKEGRKGVFDGATIAPKLGEQDISFRPKKETERRGFGSTRTEQKAELPTH